MKREQPNGKTQQETQTMAARDALAAAMAAMDAIAARDALAARAAAMAARAAMDAIAARAASSARARLAPTVALLQESAVALVERMAAVGRVLDQGEES